MQSDMDHIINIISVAAGWALTSKTAFSEGLGGNWKDGEISNRKPVFFSNSP